MPIIILGLVAVLGAALLIYYQLGPKVTERLKSGGGFFSSMFGGAPAGGPGDGAGGEGAHEQGEQGLLSTDGSGQNTKGKDGDEKVLYIFGSGEREERPLDKDGGQK